MQYLNHILEPKCVFLGLHYHRGHLVFCHLRSQRLGLVWFCLYYVYLLSNIMIIKCINSVKLKTKGVEVGKLTNYITTLLKKNILQRIKVARFFQKRVGCTFSFSSKTLQEQCVILALIHNEPMSRVLSLISQLNMQ